MSISANDSDNLPPALADKAADPISRLAGIATHACGSTLATPSQDFISSSSSAPDAANDGTFGGKSNLAICSARGSAESGRDGCI